MVHLTIWPLEPPLVDDDAARGHTRYSFRCDCGRVTRREREVNRRAEFGGLWRSWTSEAGAAKWNQLALRYTVFTQRNLSRRSIPYAGAPGGTGCLGPNRRSISRTASSHSSASTLPTMTTATSSACNAPK